MPLPRSARGPAVPALVAAALLVACGRSAPPPPPASPPAEVTVVTLSRNGHPDARTAGRTSPFLVAEVRPQVTGIVKRRLFTEGRLVKAGQALYQIDDAIPRPTETARAALARAEATLNAARPKAARSPNWRKIEPSARRTTRTRSPRCSQAEADVAAARADRRPRESSCWRTRASPSPISGPHRQVDGDAGRAGHGEPGRPRWPRCSSSTRSTSTSRSPAPSCSSCARRLAAGRLRAATDVPVTILLEDGSRYPHAGHARRSPTSPSIRRPAASRCASWCPIPDKLLLPGHVRARRARQRRARRTRCWCRSRAITRDPKGNTSAMVVGADDKVDERPVQGQPAPSAISGWSTRACAPATA